VKPAHVLAFIFLLVNFGVGVWDFYAVVNHRPRDTVSYLVREWGQENLLLVLALGALLGHLFGPVRQYPIRADEVPSVAASVSPAGTADTLGGSVVRLGAYLPLFVAGLVAGWFFLLRWFNGHPNAKTVAGGDSLGVGGGPGDD
jgi:hypothetical protein